MVSNKIYVGNHGSANVTVINGATNTATIIATGNNSGSIAVDSLTNQIYVASQSSSNLEVIERDYPERGYVQSYLSIFDGHTNAVTMTAE